MFLSASSQILLSVFLCILLSTSTLSPNPFDGAWMREREGGGQGQVGGGGKGKGRGGGGGVTVRHEELQS